jgi:hypothetical protein
MDSVLIRTTPPRRHRLRLALFSLPTLIAVVILVVLAILALAFL